MRLASELHNIAKDFGARSIAGDELGPSELGDLARQISILAKFAHSMEAELFAHRLIEANRIGRAAVEQLATEGFGELVCDPDGKIIRPDFGRK